jgi:hypothetical protein
VQQFEKYFLYFKMSELRAVVTLLDRIVRGKNQCITVRVLIEHGFQLAQKVTFSWRLLSESEWEKHANENDGDNLDAPPSLSQAPPHDSARKHSASVLASDAARHPRPFFEQTLSNVTAHISMTVSVELCNGKVTLHKKLCTFERSMRRLDGPDLVCSFVARKHFALADQFQARCVQEQKHEHEQEKIRAAAASAASCSSASQDSMSTSTSSSSHSVVVVAAAPNAAEVSLIALDSERAAAAAHHDDVMARALASVPRAASSRAPPPAQPQNRHSNQHTRRAKRGGHAAAAAGSVGQPKIVMSLVDGAAVSRSMSETSGGGGACDAPRTPFTPSVPDRAVSRLGGSGVGTASTPQLPSHDAEVARALIDSGEQQVTPLILLSDSDDLNDTDDDDYGESGDEDMNTLGDTVSETDDDDDHDVSAEESDDDDGGEDDTVTTVTATANAATVAAVTAATDLQQQQQQQASSSASVVAEPDIKRLGFDVLVTHVLSSLSIGELYLLRCVSRMFKGAVEQTALWRRFSTIYLRWARGKHYRDCGGGRDKIWYHNIEPAQSEYELYDALFQVDSERGLQAGCEQRWAASFGFPAASSLDFFALCETSMDLRHPYLCSIVGWGVHDGQMLSIDDGDDGKGSNGSDAPEPRKVWRATFSMLWDIDVENEWPLLALIESGKLLEDTSLAQRVRLCRMCVEAVHYLHSRNVCDSGAVSVSNAMVTSDFGRVRLWNSTANNFAVHEGDRMSGEPFLSSFVMLLPPEMFSGAVLDTVADSMEARRARDIFCLGALIHAIVTGTLPGRLSVSKSELSGMQRIKANAMLFASANDWYSELETIRATVPLGEAIALCLAFEPSERVAPAALLARAFSADSALPMCPLVSATPPVLRPHHSATVGLSPSRVSIEALQRLATHDTDYLLANRFCTADDLRRLGH